MDLSGYLKFCDWQRSANDDGITFTTADASMKLFRTIPDQTDIKEWGYKGGGELVSSDLERFSC